MILSMSRIAAPTGDVTIPIRVGERGHGFFPCFIEETFFEEFLFQGEELQIEVALIDLHRHVAHDELIFSSLLVDVNLPFADNGIAVLDEGLSENFPR